MRVEVILRDGHFSLRLDWDDGYYYYPLRNIDVENLKQSIENLHIKESHEVPNLLHLK